MKHCPHCNQPVPRGVRTCPECGKPLKHTAQQSAAQPTGNSLRPKVPASRLTAPLAVFVVIIMLAAAGIIFISVTRVLRINGGQHANHNPHIVTEPPVPGAAGTTETLPEGEVTLLDSELVRDLFGNDVLVVRLEYRNKGDETTLFSRNYIAKLFQDGVSCQTTTVDTGDEFVNHIKEVQPGASVIVKSAFIVDPGKDAQLTVTNYRGTFTALDTVITPKPASAESGI